MDGFPFARKPSQHSLYLSGFKVAKCEGLGNVPLPAVHLLLHHEDDHPGVDGVVEAGGAKASPGRLDFSTVRIIFEGAPNNPRDPAPLAL